MNSKKEYQKLWARDYRKSTSGRSTQLLQSAKFRARKKGGIVTIDKKWIDQKLENGFCELSGIAFNLKPNGRRRADAFAPSLDRIDSNNPNYTPENTRLVLHSLNMAIGEYGISNLLYIVREMAQKQGL